MRGYPHVDKRPAHSLTKSCGTLAIQMLADQYPAEEMQVLNFHPGAIYGPGWAEEGITEDMFPFDDREYSFHTASWSLWLVKSVHHCYRHDVSAKISSAHTQEKTI
jgi:hypothetical protein